MGSEIFPSWNWDTSFNFCRILSTSGEYPVDSFSLADVTARHKTDFMMESCRISYFRKFIDGEAIFCLATFENQPTVFVFISLRIGHENERVE